METIKSLWARYSLCKINRDIKFKEIKNEKTGKDEIIREAYIDPNTPI